MELKISNRGEKFSVTADSGKIYEIKYCGCGDGDPEYIATWQCSCPAGSHGKDCKHIKAFFAWLDKNDYEYEPFDDGTYSL